MPMTASVYGGFHFGSLDSAIESPPTPYGPYHDPAIADKAYQIPGPYGRFSDGYRSGYSSSSWRSDTMSSGLSSNPSSHDFGEEYPLFTSDMAATGVISGSPHERPQRVSYSFPYADFTLPEEIEEMVDGGHAQSYPEAGLPQVSLSANSSLQGPLVGRTANLRELINYYDQVIAPVILAFDGPTNPWRNHIIRLASGSDGLQHAIAALAASNLRMRRDYQPIMLQEQKLLGESSENRHDQSVRKSSIAHNILADQVDHPEEFALQGKHSHRELYHKSEAIRALNMELSQLRMNPYTSDETVLATLLVLCLYHICDTGVAKFKNQFAGVKKLMSLRKRRTRSLDSNWLLAMFKWFDSITATVNDREGLFEEYMEEEDADEWVLENIAGCDARLFKIISKLGRLNMLSQGKAVSDGTSTPRAQPPRPSQLYFNTPHDYNGYSGMNLATDHPLETQPQFAVEWYALHQALHDLHFDQTANPQSMQSMSAAPDQDSDIIDLRHISESFRYSALLYLERIAHPRQSSSAPNFCQLVDEAIYHIQAVKSDVYLLWPLFITGNECVREDHRDLIRQRCRSIQSDSGFYNNTSTLDLLEKTWQAKNACSASSDGPGASGPFEWRKNMNTGEEEYIVI
jgi:Fungal specific transcription factor domain